MLTVFPVTMCILFSFLIGVYYYYVKVADRCNCQTSLIGKTVVITGANTGIGKETAFELAKRGAKVILACRNQEKGENAAKDIRATTNNPHVVCRVLDLASFQSIRNFAEGLQKQEDRLDILVNNAGVVNDGSSQTEDGYDLVFGVNHLGHFLLTNLLLQKLKESSPSRIINVSSDAYQMTRLNFDNLNQNKGRISSYSHSKLANVVFTKELSRRLKNTEVTAYSLHPGCIDTDIKRNWSPFLKFMTPIIKFWILKSANDGSQTSVHCAIADNISHLSGGYFKGCKVQKISPHAADETSGRRLWEISEKMTGFKETIDVTK
ncbi:retinol dehydrogenase 11-like [Anneissia japonica]|uniref:retinol dehydrogenase 11-like n=1 Tax=Anneissia japonica TaxID=1529436 RepID=UPI0014257AE3|nr:retinol dehydrogenase 11-like [Anneissia japonica]